MSDYLDHLVIKSLQPEMVVRPRLPTQYEPWSQAEFGSPSPDLVRSQERTADGAEQPVLAAPTRTPPHPFAAQPNLSPAPPHPFAAQPDLSPAPPHPFAAQPDLSPAPPRPFAAQPDLSPAPPDRPGVAESAVAEARPSQPPAPLPVPDVPRPRKEIVERLVVERAAPILPPPGVPAPVRRAERQAAPEPAAPLPAERVRTLSVEPLAPPQDSPLADRGTEAEDQAARVPALSRPRQDLGPQIEMAVPTRPEPLDEVEHPVRQPLATVVVRPQVREAPPAVPPDAPPDAPAPMIQVTIGRVEVRATPALPAPKKQAARAPAVSLDAYLQRRNGGGR